MPNTVFEWYGYHVQNRSNEALVAARDQWCPFLEAPCWKAGGVCSVSVGADPVSIPVCPSRLYFNGHASLRRVAHVAFDEPTLDLELDQDGLPRLNRAEEVHERSRETGLSEVAVFGARPWSGEIKLPPAMEGGARYSIDFTLVAVDPDDNVRAFAPVEVQSIDTTGSYKPSVEALATNRSVVPSEFNMNWENVNKRILPQLIIKGLMLQAESLCRTGIYFITPEAVYDRIMLRLGGPNRLRRIPPQPGAITFHRYRHSAMVSAEDSEPIHLQLLDPVTVSTSDLSLAFITPENLPPGGSYSAAIKQKLSRSPRPPRH